MVGPTRMLAAACAVAAVAGAPALAADSQDICTLLPQAKVAEILRTPVALAEPNSDETSRSCVYSLTKDGPNVVVTRLGGDWEAIRATFRTSPSQPVAGLGRQALWYPIDHALQVQADNGTVLRIGFSARETEIAEKHKAAAIDLARAALVALQ